MTTEPEVTPSTVTDVVSPDHAQHLRLLEALIFAGTQALDEQELADRLPNDADVKRLLADLGEIYAGRGVNLVQVAGGYAFRTAPDLSEKLKIERPVTRKLSRAAIETLAIIAYHQPVTRTEIEQVRGVAVDGVMQTLLERSLVEQLGRAEVVGRPMTYGTTALFLEYFGLRALEDLPAADELRRMVVQKPEALVTAEPGLATVPPEQLALPAEETKPEIKTDPQAPTGGENGRGA